MTKRDKLILKIKENRNVSYDEAESVLLNLGFDVEITGSHHIFRKNGYHKNISLKIRAELKRYQLKLLQEVLEEHGY
jgi:hypothetical protein